MWESTNFLYFASSFLASLFGSSVFLKFPYEFQNQFLQKNTPAILIGIVVESYRSILEVLLINNIGLLMHERGNSFHLFRSSLISFNYVLHIVFSVQVFRSDQIRSVTQSCPTLRDPMNRSTPGLPVHHQLPEFTETHIHRVSDAIQPSHALSSPSPPAPNPSQHQSLFQ